MNEKATKLCPESFKRTAKMSTFTKEKLFPPKLWETLLPKVCIEKRKCARSVSTKTQQQVLQGSLSAIRSDNKSSDVKPWATEINFIFFFTL